MPGKICSGKQIQNHIIHGNGTREGFQKLYYGKAIPCLHAMLTNAERQHAHGTAVQTTGAVCDDMQCLEHTAGYIHGTYIMCSVKL